MLRAPLVAETLGRDVPDGGADRRPAGGFDRDRRLGIDCDGTRSDTTLTQQQIANFRQLRRRRYVEEIDRRGGLRLHWAAWEQAVRHGLITADAADRLLETFATADPQRLFVTGGDRMPQGPIRAIAGRSR